MSSNILEWTIMPFKIVAKAWTDSTFLTNLLANPNTVIQQNFFEVPLSYNFIINQDSGTTRYLTLPYFNPIYKTWTQEQITGKLTVETGGDISMQYFLPAHVINKAFFDAAYTTALLTNANSALGTAGMSAPGGATIIVSENTATDHYLTLPLLPLDWAGLSYSKIFERLLFNGSQTHF